MSRRVLQFLLRAAFSRYLRVFMFGFGFFGEGVVRVGGRFVVSVLGLDSCVVRVLRLIFVRLSRTGSLIVVLVWGDLSQKEFSYSNVSRRRAIVYFLSFCGYFHIIGRLFLYVFVACGVV